MSKLTYGNAEFDRCAAEYDAALAQGLFRSGRGQELSRAPTDRMAGRLSAKPPAPRPPFGAQYQLVRRKLEKPSDGK
jgi:hypothetical protein